MRPSALALLACALAGCSALAALRPPAGAALLAQADGLAAEGRYEDALAAYEDWLRRHPDAGEARRVRASRAALAALVEARAEVARLRRQLDEVAGLRDELAARERELARVRGELAGRDGEVARLRQEVARLAAEADRLRADLETLKRVDLEMERRRR